MQILGVTAAAAVLVAAGVVRWERLADRPAADVPSPAASALAQTTPDLDLASSTQAEKDHEPEVATVLVTRKHLSVGGDATPIATFPEGLRALAATGLPPRYKRGGPNDLYVSELGNALTFWHDAEIARARGAGSHESPPLALAVLADASMPYRILVEVLFTGAQSGFARFELAARAADGSLRWLVSTPPPSGSRELLAPREARSLRLTVWVADAGVWVGAYGRNLAPGCDDLGPGASVPKIAGAYDDRGLGACLRKLKDRVPSAKDETSVVLSASSSIELQAIASTMDALKGTAETGPLFPDVQLGVSRGEPALDDGTPDRGGSLADLGGRRKALSGAAVVPAAKGKGSASIGGASVSGGNIANASAVVAGMGAGFRRCYNKGLQEDPKMTGSVRITAKIGPAGEVISATPSGSGVSGTVLSCVTARVSSAQFAPPDGGRATIVIPVTFVTQ